MHKELEKKLGYLFKDQKLIELALTHSSIKKNNPQHSYEKLEFLGDRVLGLAVADYIFNHHKNENEGQLAKRLAHVCSKESCAKVAEKLELIKHIKALRRDLTPTSNILPDAVEAILGAIYLDGGYLQAKTVTLSLWQDILIETNILPTDFKTALQEWSQEHHAITPTYTVLEEKGPAHAPTFTIKVDIMGAESAIASGASKRQAEQKAAEALYKKVMNHDR